ncbi:hypothetical protein [Pseudonocardia thermophila]|uniref:hypothetical protein n=1 Tax=Pseudonocardia thermophila TaxID=1848 RepID=UPI0011611D42|nr:hypothetical protein [Pseudonocardia thermophila]
MTDLVLPLPAVADADHHRSVLHAEAARHRLARLARRGRRSATNVTGPPPAPPGEAAPRDAPREEVPAREIADDRRCAVPR